MTIRGINISDTSLMHYSKFVLRSLLFAVCTIIYIYSRVHGDDPSYVFLESYPHVIWLISGIFTMEMCFRFFPSGLESRGCQKQFAVNYKPRNSGEAPRTDKETGTVAVLISWLALNTAVALLYYFGIIDQGILILISLAYAVCDMICILFYCPFQTLMMKNKCCGTCRIYNWDFIMMFTPCIFIDHPAAKLLLAFAAVLCIEWEIIYKLHSERFAENTNAFLSCENCTEKLCSHKKQLQRYLVKFRKKLAEENERILKLPQKRA